MTGEILTRCQSGRPCDHVVALVTAGQQALHVTGCPDEGKALLAHAQQLAHWHHYGQAVDLEEAS